VAEYDENLVRVKLLAAASQDPTLTDEELTGLLDGWRLVDSEGRRPDDDQWVPTYNVDGAVAEAYRVKAGRVADQYTFGADGATYNRDQRFAHLTAMAEKYERRAKARSGGTVLTVPFGGMKQQSSVHDTHEIVP